MEALQILKFALKKTRLDFTACLHLPEHPLTSDAAKGANLLMEMLKLKPNALQTFLHAVNPND